MANYFPCDIPLQAPAYAHTALAAKWQPLAQRMHERFDKLNGVLDALHCDGERFSVAARKVFSDENGENLAKTDAGSYLIDEMSAAEILTVVTALLPRIGPQPKRYEWKNAVPIIDTAFVAQEEWELIRVLSIGGSDAAVAMGISPYRSQFSLYHDKVGTPTEAKTDSGKAFIFEYGHRIEPLVISEFCRRTGAVVIPESRMFRHKTIPYLTANVDGIVVLPDGRMMILECKTTTNFNRDAWAGGKVPPQYIPQTNQYMCVLDEPAICGTYIACIYGNTPDAFVAQYLERDRADEDAQNDIIIEFWNEHVVPNVEPPMSTKTITEDYYAYKKLPTDESLPHMVFDEVSAELIEKYLTLKEQRKEYEKMAEATKAQEAELAADFGILLGATSVGYYDCGNGYMYEVKQAKASQRNNVDKEKLTLLYPDVAREVMTVSTSLGMPTIAKKKKPKKLVI